eukprot:TRINITY_DN60299_c0_g1_i1.p1 TRINITY_DN60299_c0_g1~~TRINITY_DN60299_c0_g1_i1.p1  ORF type:complete len:435 (+),score=93.64 TRINITY_DN60299_c0_g1_i1:124-1428(+)
MLRSLVGSEMCIRDRTLFAGMAQAAQSCEDSSVPCTIRNLRCAPGLQVGGSVFASVSIDERLAFKTPPIDLDGPDSWPEHHLLLRPGSRLIFKFYGMDAMSSDYIGGITIEYDRLAWELHDPSGMDQASLTADMVDATRSWKAGSFSCLLESEHMEDAGEIDGGDAPVARECGALAAPEVVAFPSSPPVMIPSEPSGINQDRNQWYDDKWKLWREQQARLPRSHPSDFRSKFVAANYAEQVAALQVDREIEDKQYCDSSERRSAERAVKQREAAEAQGAAAALNRRRLQMRESEKNTTKQATELVISKVKDSSCWVQKGNNMTAIGVDFLSAEGQVRLTAGHWTLSWNISIEKDAVLDNLVFEIFVPSTQTTVLKRWGTFEISRSRGKGMLPLQVGEFDIKMAQDTVQFKIWNHSTRVKRGLTLGQVEFKAHLR